MNFSKVGSGVSKIGGIVEKAGQTYGGKSDSDSTGSGGMGRKVGSMARRAVGKMRARRKNGESSGKPVFKYSGKTMSA
jgi:hypothetical protein